jgi:hypothetical protein
MGMTLRHLRLMSLGTMAFGMQTQNVTLLGLDPHLTLDYSEAELAPFLPPVATISMGSAPSDLFTAGRNVAAVAIAPAPIVT